MSTKPRFSTLHVIARTGLALALGVTCIFGQTDYAAYVMGYFKESPNGSSNSAALHIAVSMDGLNWIPLNQNNSVVKPSLGTKNLRDPFFYRMPDGSFTIVATDNWNSEFIHVWSSADLRSFDNERLIRMNTKGMHSWAPEIFYDALKKQYAIIWSGNTDRNRIYVNYTSDFITVSNPEIFFDPGFSVIDGHMEVNVNGVNYMYYKNEKDFKLYGTKSTSLEKGSFNTNTYTTGYGAPYTGSHTEAPILIKNIQSNTWWLWGDSYNPINAVFYNWKTNDITTNSWTATSFEEYTAPLNSKHATVVPITATELSNLILKWGKPQWDILKSYKRPNAFLRNAGSNAKISNYPFDPVSSMQWKIVKGLADSTGISFESVSSPGSFLRQENYLLGVAKGDGTSSFKSNATFYKERGFANSNWHSLRSHAVPDRYIRLMADSTLRLDPITVTSILSDKQDATFKLVYASIDLNPIPPKQEPYLGVVELPGTLQVENYDKGGNNISFYDIDAGNRGSAYRNDDVDLVANGENISLGYVDNGEWLEYSVNVKSSIVNSFTAHVASQSDSASFSVFLDDKVVAKCSVPNTGSWSEFKDVQIDIPSLPVGEHTLKVQIDMAYFNLDWIRFDDVLPTHSYPYRSLPSGNARNMTFDLLGRHFNQ